MAPLHGEALGESSPGLATLEVPGLSLPVPEEVGAQPTRQGLARPYRVQLPNLRKNLQQVSLRDF